MTHGRHFDTFLHTFWPFLALLAHVSRIHRIKKHFFKKITSSVLRYERPLCENISEKRWRKARWMFKDVHLKHKVENFEPWMGRIFSLVCYLLTIQSYEFWISKFWRKYRFSWFLTLGVKLSEVCNLLTRVLYIYENLHNHSRIKFSSWSFETRLLDLF